MARRSLVIAAVAVLAVAVGGVFAWLVLTRPEPEPAPPTGMKYVGNDGVVFAVPEDWVIIPPDPCTPLSTEPYVTFEASVTMFCPAMTEPQPPHVLIERRWDGESLEGLEYSGLVPSLRALPDGWTTVPWAETLASSWPELDEVTEAFDRAGLEKRVELVYDKKLHDGTVLESDPPWGSVIEEGGTVTLTVTTDEAPTAGASSSP